MNEVIIRKDITQSAATTYTSEEVLTGLQIGSRMAIEVEKVFLESNALVTKSELVQITSSEKTSEENLSDDDMIAKYHNYKVAGEEQNEAFITNPLIIKPSIHIAVNSDDAGGARTFSIVIKGKTKRLSTADYQALLTQAVL